jgi:hypothetical protein
MSEAINVSGTITGTLTGNDGTNSVSLPLRISVTGVATITPHATSIARPGPPPLQGAVHHIAPLAGVRSTIDFTVPRRDRK